MKASPKKKKSLEKLFFLLLIVFSAIPLLGADYFGYLTSPVRHAVLQDTRQDMVARVGGNIRFFFREGQEFKNGDLLASLEMEKRQSTLREADLKLSQMQAILPPSYGGVTENHQSIEEKIETSDLNLRKLRAQEIKNREALEEISLAEARAAVEERRLLSRSRKGYVDYEAMDRAELDHKKLQEERARRKDALELISLERASIEKERQKLKNLQEASGVTEIPEKTRIAMFENQKAQRDLAKAEFEGSIIKAPFGGRLEALYVQDTDLVEQGQRLMTLKAERDFLATIKAQVLMRQNTDLKIGSFCKVILGDLSEDLLNGVVVDLKPIERTGLRSGLAKFLQETEITVQVPVADLGNLSPDELSVGIFLQE